MPPLPHPTARIVAALLACVLSIVVARQAGPDRAAAAEPAARVAKAKCLRKKGKARGVVLLKSGQERRKRCRARTSQGPSKLPLDSTLASAVAAPLANPTAQTPAAQKGSPAQSAPPGPTSTGPVIPPLQSLSQIFSPTSFWNEPLADDAPLDPNTALIVGRFESLVAAERREEKGPSVNTNRWSVPLYVVPVDQPTVRVEHRNPNGFSPALQAAWEAIPLPPDAQPAEGSDRHLVVWQPGADKLWEFWKLSRDGSGWHARWGGAMRNVSTNPGVYGPEAWPGATTGWGGSASSLSLAGGLITLEDLARGEIDHAVVFSSPDVRAGVYSAPAMRTDGATESSRALPEGARMRLDPNLDLSTLEMPPFTRMLAQAVQRYGMILRSRSGIISFIAQDPTPTGTDPYKGPQGFFGGEQSNALLASFPWKHLQLLRMELSSQKAR